MAESPNSVPVTVEATVELHSLDSRAFWLDALDRAGRSFLQNVLVFFGAGVTIVSVSWTSLLGAAALAALVSLILAVSTATAVTSGNFLVDLADRAVRTGAGSLAAAIPVTGSITNIDWPASLTIAGTAALLSVVTSLLTENRGAAKGLPSLAPVDPVTVPDVINPTGSVTELRGE
ncbi:holin [Rhodococcus sp. USK10]|uniref:holin n=1 Tax=Rhodococcus sp. USK10 TaxID=2789739 RepID=UPI0021518B7D|nr:holin [Rhodococcus sp. USK10]